MTSGEPAFLVVGYVSKPHGTRGELLVEPLTDHPGDAFVPGMVLRTEDGETGQPDADLPPLRIDGVRPFQRGWLISFGGVTDRNAADFFRGRYLLIERERLSELGEGEIFFHQLLGMEIVTVDGSPVGEVTEVYERRPADLLEVRTAHGTVLVPFLDWIVREVDVAGRRMVIDPPEGLLEP